MITFSKVSKTYTPKKGVPVEALKEVSFSLPDKGLFFILGRSGSGKSAALRPIVSKGCKKIIPMPALSVSKKVTVPRRRSCSAREK